MGRGRGQGSVVIGLLALFGCTNGPGRPPVFPNDASVEDLGTVDVGVPDSGDVRDAGSRDVPFAVMDAGPQPVYPFTGIFGILNSADLLFAREVDGRIHIVINSFPYSYTGTIDADGNVDATSVELTRGGCLVARITGTYGRFDATFALDHVTCNALNEPLSGRLTGGFFDNFDPFRSGVYQIVGQVEGDPDNCFDTPTPFFDLTLAVSFTSDGRAMVFAAEDVVPGAATYFGHTINSSWTFNASQLLTREPSLRVFALSGEFSQVTANDPVTLTLQRTAFHPDTGCAFQIQASGDRVALP